MKRMSMVASLFAVISLMVSVIWPIQVMAAVSPTLTYLGTFPERLSAPGTIEVDGDGNIYVADADHGVYKFNRGGKLVANYDLQEVTSKGISVSPGGDYIYVAARDKVLILNADGEPIEAFGAGAGEFEDASEIDTDADGYIYVVDVGRYVVRKYDASGVYQGVEFSVASGATNSIQAMAIDAASGELYIADMQGSVDLADRVVRVYDLAGNYLRQMGGVGLGGFGGIEFDDQGRTYMLDSIGNKMLVWDGSGSTLKTVSAGGLLVGEGVDTSFKNYIFAFPIDAVYDEVNSRLLMIAGSMIAVLGIDSYTIPVSNEPPGVPQPVDPIAGSEVGSETPTLTFTEPSDPDGDTLTYSVEVNCGAGPALYTSIAGTSFQVPVSLTENQACTWRVQADDGAALSEWSDSATFVVNAVQEAPTTPVLDLPLTGALLNVDSQFSWGGSSDPDPGAAISYRIELATDAGFASLIDSGSFVSLSVAIDAFAAFSELGPQTDYFWRVIAVDDDGLESLPSEVRSFTLYTTSLAIDANIPGAKVYFGGNHAYSGRLVGETPYVANHLLAGTYSVVLAYPGLESAVGTVEVVAGEKTAATFALAPAYASGSFSGGKLVSGKLDRMTGQVSPFLVDFDNDGELDILVGDSIGQLILFPGLERDPEATSLKVGPKQVLDVDLAPGAAPFVVDWNNDDKKDLLAGTSGGSLLLLMNVGTNSDPVFDAAEYLLVGGYPVNAGADAVPMVMDFDRDGDKDLLVGNGAGSLLLYVNSGTDSAPELDAGLELLRVEGAASPFAADLDGNGNKELFIAAGTDVLKVVGDGDALTTQLLFSASSNGNGGMRGPLRLFVADVDGKKGKDFILGTASGKLEVERSGSNQVSAAFVAALNDKLDQVASILADSEPALLSQVEDVRADVQVMAFDTALVASQELLAGLLMGSDANISVGELVGLLEQVQ